MSQAKNVYRPNFKQAAATFLMGAALKLDGNGGLLKVTDQGGALVPLRAAAGNDPADLATVGQVMEKATLTVQGQIDGTAPPDPTANDGQVFVVTTAGNSYSLRELYLATGGNWEALSLYDGRRIAVADALTGGSIEFQGDRIYQYNEEAGAYADMGATTSLAGVLQESATSVAFDASSPATVHGATPGDLREITIRVAEAFDDGNATLDSLQDGGGNDVVDPANLNLDLTDASAELAFSVGGDANTDINLAWSPASATKGKVEVLTEYRSA